MGRTFIKLVAISSTLQPHRSTLCGKAMTSQFNQDVLNEHNKYRAQHSAAPLELDGSMNRYAQEWAENLAKRNILQHRTDRMYGENLYAMFGKTDISAGDAVQSWYKEIKDYTFGQPDPGVKLSKVGHFTQLVWKGSKRLGVGMAINKDKKAVYVVCNYDPPGNFKNRYADNVCAK